MSLRKFPLTDFISCGERMTLAVGTPRHFPLDTPKHTLSKKRIMPPSSMGGERKFKGRQDC